MTVSDSRSTVRKPAQQTRKQLPQNKNAYKWSLLEGPSGCSIFYDVFQRTRPSIWVLWQLFSCVLCRFSHCRSGIWHSYRSVLIWIFELFLFDSKSLFNPTSYLSFLPFFLLFLCYCRCFSLYCLSNLEFKVLLSLSLFLLAWFCSFLFCLRLSNFLW